MTDTTDKKKKLTYCEGCEHSKQNRAVGFCNKRYVTDGEKKYFLKLPKTGYCVARRGAMKTVTALCWDCKRTDCLWVRNGELPAGVLAQSETEAPHGYDRPLRRVFDCPEFEKAKMKAEAPKASQQQPYLNLREAVVRDGMNVYGAAMAKLYRDKTDTNAKLNKAEVERFFKSEWFEDLTGIENGGGIIAEVRKATKRMLAQAEKDLERAEAEMKAARERYEQAKEAERQAKAAGSDKQERTRLMRLRVQAGKDLKTAKNFVAENRQILKKGRPAKRYNVNRD
ncbi:MAG: hypothetical protein ACOX7J_06490 [Bacillota bacterium]|jgi:hypothetical protein